MNSTLSSGAGSSNNNQFGRHTAREFFSKENLTHPVVEENQKLREKLRLLEETSSQKGGGMQSLNAEADRVA